MGCCPIHELFNKANLIILIAGVEFLLFNRFGGVADWRRLLIGMVLQTPFWVHCLSHRFWGLWVSLSQLGAGLSLRWAPDLTDYQSRAYQVSLSWHMVPSETWGPCPWFSLQVPGCLELLAPGPIWGPHVCLWSCWWCEGLAVGWCAVTSKPQPLVLSSDSMLEAAGGSHCPYVWNQSGFPLFEACLFSPLPSP